MEFLTERKPIKTYTVVAEWDNEAGVWYVADSDVPGLATEAPTPKTLAEKLRVMVSELLHENAGLPLSVADVPVHLRFEHRELLHVR